MYRRCYTKNVTFSPENINYSNYLIFYKHKNMKDSINNYINNLKNSHHVIIYEESNNMIDYNMIDYKAFKL